jgi:hypothetical protein
MNAAFMSYDGMGGPGSAGAGVRRRLCGTIGTAARGARPLTIKISTVTLGWSGVGPRVRPAQRARSANRPPLTARRRLHDVVMGGDPPTAVLLQENQHQRGAHLSARPVTGPWRRDWHAGDAKVEVDNGDIRPD